MPHIRARVYLWRVARVKQKAKGDSDRLYWPDFSDICMAAMEAASKEYSGNDTRPSVAIIANAQTPYRLHVQTRIVREIPQVKLWSVFTHDIGDNHFSQQAPDEINPVFFGKGEITSEQRGLRWFLWEWRKGRRVIRWLKENRVRAVMVQGYNDAGRIRIIRWCRRNGMPCFLFGDSNIHGDLATGLKAWVKMHVVRRVVRACSGIMFCGRFGREYFLKYGAAESQLFNFPYEPDYELIRNLPQEKIDEAKTKFGLKAGRRRLVFSGRLVGAKRPDLLIGAFTAIADQRPDWDLVMVGDGTLRDALKSRVPDRLKDRIIWTGFVDDQQMVSAVYRLSDVLVLPSDYEPWALVINEAAAAGMAIIASSVVGAAAELVKDHVNGRLFKVGDPADLTSCLLDVTSVQKIDAAKSASPMQVEDWLRRGDPVEGWRMALKSSGVL